jgi:hypothetical protein
MLSDVLNINFERKFSTAFTGVIYNFTAHFTCVIWKSYNPSAIKTRAYSGVTQHLSRPCRWYPGAFIIYQFGYRLG